MCHSLFLDGYESANPQGLSIFLGARIGVKFVSGDLLRATPSTGTTSGRCGIARWDWNVVDLQYISLLQHAYWGYGIQETRSVHFHSVRRRITWTLSLSLRVRTLA